MCLCVDHSQVKLGDEVKCVFLWEGMTSPEEGKI